MTKCSRWGGGGCGGGGVGVLTWIGNVQGWVGCTRERKMGVKKSFAEKKNRCGKQRRTINFPICSNGTKAN